MKVKRIYLGGLVATFLTLNMAQAQTGQSGHDSLPSSAVPPAAAPGNGAAAAPASGLSSYILYDRCPGCCGPVGGNGPIYGEVYLRSGLSFSMGGGLFGDVLSPGWSITGGGRSLFFNPEVDRAWTVDLGIINTYNYASIRGRTLFLHDPNSPAIASVAARSLNETLVSLSGGCEHYLMGNADMCADHVMWRIGMDGGGRYGNFKLETTQFRNRTDSVAGLFVAAHSDVEFPWGHCVFFMGLRAEYGFTWSDILEQGNDGDVQTINLLANFGVRF